MHQAEAKAQAIATSAMKKIGSTLEHWFERGVDAALKEIARQFFRKDSRVVILYFLVNVYGSKI
jgi:hypothetical protein